MIRRLPTRIEFNIDNLTEWTEARAEKKKSEMTEDQLKGSMEDNISPDLIKAKRDLIHERIGYASARQSTPQQPYNMNFTETLR